MATKVWRGFLNFQLISIPVYLNVGARDNAGISFNNLHDKCKGRVRRPDTCEVCNQRVTSAEIIKGYETTEGQYAIITKEEIEAIEPESGKVMEITACVEARAVDAMYLAESFYLLPDAPGVKAYGLIVKALADSGRVAIAQLTKNNREHVVLLRPRGNGLVAHFLWYENEVCKNAEFDSLKAPLLTANELKLAGKVIEQLVAPWRPEQYKDGYQERLAQLVQSKLDKTVSAPTPVKTTAAPVMDLMAALEASLKAPKRQITLDDDESAAAPAKKSAKKSRRAA